MNNFDRNTYSASYLTNRIQNAIEIGDCTVEIHRAFTAGNDFYRFECPIFEATIELHSDGLTRDYYHLRYNEPHNRTHRRTLIAGAGSEDARIIANFINHIVLGR